MFLVPPVSPLLFVLFNLEVNHNNWITLRKRSSILNSNSTHLLFYFDFLSQLMLLSSFILVEICVLRSSGWLAVYYSTPGALKVRGLHVRSPQDLPLIAASCWLNLERQGEEEARVWSMPLWEFSEQNPFCSPHRLDKIPFLDAGSIRRGHRLYRFTAWPL